MLTWAFLRRLRLRKAHGDMSLPPSPFFNPFGVWVIGNLCCFWIFKNVATPCRILQKCTTFGGSTHPVTFLKNPSNVACNSLLFNVIWYKHRYDRYTGDNWNLNPVTHLLMPSCILNQKGLNKRWTVTKYRTKNTMHCKIPWSSLLIFFV